MRGVVLALLSGGLVACGGATVPTPASSTADDGIGATVLVSGRDDHGLLQDATLPLYVEPDGDAVVGDIPDGEFATVLEIRGTWLRIQSLADPSTSGWIDDFHLRDRAVLHNAQQVRFVAARPGDPVEVKVRLMAAPDADPFWVTADHLDEVGADVAPHDH